MMDAASQDGLGSSRSTERATVPNGGTDRVVRWQSTFGLVIIEVRGEQVFVNGDLVETAGPEGGVNS